MKKAIIPIFLFLIQIYLLLCSVPNHDISKEINPFVLLAVSLFLPAYYLWYFITKQDTFPAIGSTSFSKKLIGFVLGCCSVLLLFSIIRHMFQEYNNYAQLSDVVPAVEALYSRFKAGVQPYAPLEQYSWHPYPLYLPLYWLPAAVTDIVGINIRWTGIFMFVIAAGVFGIYCWKSQKNILLIIIALILPSVGVWAYLIWGRFDVSVSFEFIIAAYYLILATGLASRNLPLTTAGIICCLLSRFTLIFWIPIFVPVLWINVPKKQTITSAIIVLIAIFGIYIIPFLLRDPSTFLAGLKAHRACGIAEWNGYGEPPVSWTFESGIHLAPYFKKLFNGDIEHRVKTTQLWQTILMLITVVTSLLLYRKWKDKINFYDYSLPFLYLVMLLYFMTAPLTFKYYYLPLLVVSGVLCAKILLSENKVKG